MSLNHNDKSRIDYEKQKEFKLLILDKIVISGIILIMATGGTLYLEYYRNKSQEKRYFLQSFNLAIAEIMEVASEIQMKYTQFTGTMTFKEGIVKPALEGKSHLKDFYDNSFENLIRLDSLRGKYSYLFSEELDLEIQRFVSLHLALVDPRTQNKPTYRLFMIACERQLKYQVQQELGIPKRIKKPEMEVDYSFDANEDVLDYLKRMYKQWAGKNSAISG